MSAIWENNKTYLQLRPYVDACTRSSYSSLEVKGMERVPQDIPVILVPNHSNCLMDALVVLQCFKGKPVAFGARADIFRNPRIAKVLRWLRILPFARERDGRAALESNISTFDEVIDCIGHGVPFTIFAEGTHRAKHSLLPLKNGAFRIAVSAAKHLGREVALVPVGIDYSDYFAYRSRCIVTFGSPITVREGDDVQELKRTTTEALSHLFTFFPDDENYDAAFGRCYLARKRTPLPAERLMLGILVPALAMAAVCSGPALLASWMLGRRMKDKVWLNTVRFGVKLLALPVWTLIVAACALIIWKSPVYALIGGIAAWGGYDSFHEIKNSIKQLI